jgi:hypothetical protein
MSIKSLELTAKGQSGTVAVAKVKGGSLFDSVLQLNSSLGGNELGVTSDNNVVLFYIKVSDHHKSTNSRRSVHNCRQFGIMVSSLSEL